MQIKDNEVFKFKSAYKDTLTYTNGKVEVSVRDYRTMWLPEEEYLELRDSEYFYQKEIKEVKG